MNDNVVMFPGKPFPGGKAPKEALTPRVRSKFPIRAGEELSFAMPPYRDETVRLFADLNGDLGALCRDPLAVAEWCAAARLPAPPSGQILVPPHLMMAAVHALLSRGLGVFTITKCRMTMSHHLWSGEGWQLYVKVERVERVQFGVSGEFRFVATVFRQNVSATVFSAEASVHQPRPT